MMNKKSPILSRMDSGLDLLELIESIDKTLSRLRIL